MGEGEEEIMEKKIYLVTWEIHVLAESPRDAAEQALKIHRNPESIATVFTVDGQDIDLGEPQ